MSTEKEQKVYEVLESLGVSYEKHEHPPVYTVEEAEQYWKDMSGAHCKNLFLRNKKGKRHYLLVLEHSKKADLKSLTKRLNEDTLSFASGDRLMRFLGLEAGAVSPFGLINDTQKAVQVVIDRDLQKAGKIGFHPNVNTATVLLEFTDFEKFLEYCGNPVRYLHF